MKKLTKEKLSIFGLHLLIFFVAIVCSFMFLFDFIYIFNKFGLVSELWTLVLPAVASIVISAAITIYSAVRFKTSKVTKLSHWLSLHWPKLILIFILLNIFFLSIKTELTWDEEKIKQILSVEWTIFGFSLTIFLVWHVILVDYLKKKEPQRPEDDSYSNKYLFLLTKVDFYQRADSLFGTLILLIINLITLLLATASVYVVFDKLNLFTQTLVLLGFYLSTNTISALFLDILTPVMESKKELLKKNKVEENEIKAAYTEVVLQNMFNTLMTVAFKDVFTEEEKAKILSRYLEKHSENEPSDTDAKEKQELSDKSD